jgi:hypothetical protein
MSGSGTKRTSLVVVPICRTWVDKLPFSSEFEFLMRVGRWPFLALLILGLLAVLYRVGPCRSNAKWRWVSVGSVFATVVWLLASAAFSIYVSNFANYDKTYGTLGAVIILLLRLYISFYIILLGAEINAELELQTAVDTTTGRPKPMGKRGAFVADHVAGGPRGDRRPSSHVTCDLLAVMPLKSSTNVEMLLLFTMVMFPPAPPVALPPAPPWPPDPLPPAPPVPPAPPPPPAAAAAVAAL